VFRRLLTGWTQQQRTDQLVEREFYQSLSTTLGARVTAIKNVANQASKGRLRALYPDIAHEVGLIAAESPYRACLLLVELYRVGSVKEDLEVDVLGHWLREPDRSLMHMWAKLSSAADDVPRLIDRLTTVVERVPVGRIRDSDFLAQLVSLASEAQLRVLYPTIVREVKLIAAESPREACSVLAELYTVGSVTDDLESEVLRHWLREPDRSVPHMWAKLSKAVDDIPRLIESIVSITETIPVGDIHGDFLLKPEHREKATKVESNSPSLTLLKEHITVSWQKRLKEVSINRNSRAQSNIGRMLTEPAGGPSTPPLEQRRGLPPAIDPGSSL
jgi:hypothetical protein